MSALPERLSADVHLEPHLWWKSPWLRRGLLLLPTALIIAGLLNVFGQRPTTSVAKGPRAMLTVYAPTHARSGLVYAARFRVDARADLKDVALVLGPGWAEGFTVNGLSPQPLREGSRNGSLSFEFGHLAAGRHLTFWLSLQVNPTNVGRHQQDVRLYDGDRLVARIDRAITIFP